MVLLYKHKIINEMTMPAILQSKLFLSDERVKWTTERKWRERLWQVWEGL